MHLPQLLSHAAGHADHIGFAGVVARHIRPAGQQPRRGCHIQDGAAALRVHLAHHGAEQPRHGGNIHLDHLFLAGFLRFQNAAADAETGVVDEDVDVFIGQYFAQAAALLGAGEVGGLDAAFRAVGCVQLLGKSLQTVGAAGSQDEPTAHSGIPAGELPADAGACSGDPDGLLHGGSPFFRPKTGLSVLVALILA